MLYPRSTEKKPDPVLFRQPTAEYRGAPFWAWNCDLDDDMLRREIEVMHQMGMGGLAVGVRRRVRHGKRRKPAALSAVLAPQAGG